MSIEDEIDNIVNDTEKHLDSDAEHRKECEECQQTFEVMNELREEFPDLSEDELEFVCRDMVRKSRIVTMVVLSVADYLDANGIKVDEELCDKLDTKVSKFLDRLYKSYLND